MHVSTFKIIGVSLAAFTLAPIAARAQDANAVMPLPYTLHFGDKAFKVHTKASILSYPITFMQAAQASAGDIGIYLAMRGPSEADMRALSNEAFDDLSARLTAAGYEIVPSPESARHADIAALPKVPGNGKWDSGVPDPYGKRVWFMVSPDRAPLYTALGSKTGAAEPQLAYKLRKASSELNTMMVLPRLVIDFSTLGAATASGSKGTTFWAGGKVQFMVKASSIGYAWSGGGKRSDLYVVSAFYPKKRDYSSPWPLQGELTKGARPLSPELARQMSGGRHDVFTVDMDNWRTQVRAAFRGYNKAMVDAMITSKAKK